MGMSLWRLVPGLALLLGAPNGEGDRLEMTEAVACESVAGFGDYVERPEATLAADEKLLVYYEPRHFATERVGSSYRAHFIQDARIRRRGRKEAILSKDKLLDFTAKGATRPERVYLTNTIALQGLKPGEYDLDIILHDDVAKGRPALQTLRFTIKPPAPDLPAEKREGSETPR